ncbi:MAG: chaperone modulator CbpM [Gammaproteobacteria bacterium]|nr:chaperone modulator CbpM [Gammaproteobacteria bacterium]MDH3377316.1 chaperone modulator CbpM [Gammaproteobacteria bacterium]
MAKQATDTLNGIILEEEARLTLRELCDACVVNADFICELVDEGMLEPAGQEKSHWYFTGISLRRVRRAQRLQRDLGINLAGVALALDLLDEVDQLREQLNRLSVPGQE